jgi:prophage tail gpP-like protein
VVSPSLSAGDRSISIKGRCKTGDLVDCSATAKTYKGQTLAQLAAAIAEGFGIAFSINGTDTAIDTFTVAPGEKIHAAIERAARARGVLMVGTAKGNVVFTAPGSTLSTTRIVEGVNLKTGSGDFSAQDRFSKYELIGHGGGAWDGKAATPTTATDAGARTPRKLIIVEDGLPADLATKRVQWEAATRAARSTKLTVSVVGWRQDSGELWRPNLLVSVVSPSLGVDGKFLISGVTFSKSDGGTVATLELRQRGAFAVQPQIEKKEGAQWTQ